MLLSPWFVRGSWGIPVRESHPSIVVFVVDYMYPMICSGILLSFHHFLQLKQCLIVKQAFPTLPHIKQVSDPPFFRASNLITYLNWYIKIWWSYQLGLWHVDLSLYEDKARDILQICISIKTYIILLLCEETLIPVLKSDNNILDLQYVFFDIIKKFI